MPRHRQDSHTQMLRARFEETRSSIRSAVNLVTDNGIKQKEVALLAGMTPAYLSQICATEDRNPTPPKTTRLLKTLEGVRAGADLHFNPQDADQWRATLDLYSLPESIVVPPGSMVGEEALNYVDRSASFPEYLVYSDRDIRVGGAPMAGRTQLLRTAAKALVSAYGESLEIVDLSSSISDSDLFDQSRTGLRGVVAAHLKQSTVPLDYDHFEVNKVLDEALAEKYRQYARLALVGDGLSYQHHQELLGLRGTFKSKIESSVPQMHVLTAGSSEFARSTDLEQADDYEIGYAASWFSRDEVDHLVDELAPVMFMAQTPPNRTGNRHINPNDFINNTKEEIWQRFSGQPSLTQEYLWALSKGQTDINENIIIDHTSRLARVAINVLFDRPEKLAVSMENDHTSTEELDTYELMLLKTLGVISLQEDARGGKTIKWPSKIYASYMPEAIKEEMAAYRAMIKRRKAEA